MLFLSLRVGQAPIFRRSVSISDYPSLERVTDMAIKEKQKFERLVVSKETLLEMFSVESSNQVFISFKY